MIFVNTIESIFNSTKKTVENDVKAEVAHIEGEVSNDTSRLIHSLSVTTISAGKDITVRLDHAAGEVKRIVVNGTLSVEGLLKHLVGLTTPPVA
jgi:hypothetical protein